MLLGYGPVPAQWARNLIHASSDTTPMWLRRLYRDPQTGDLAAMDSRRRCFTSNQRHFLRIRDGDTCRTPWCGAPLRHHDHVRAVEHGGPTSVHNAQGTCAACNYTKQAAGWSATTDLNGTIRLVTPTGHTYTHRPPRPPGAPPDQRQPAA